MGFVVFACLLTGGGCLVGVLAKKSFALALPCFLTGTVFVLYWAALLGGFTAGVWLVGLAALAGFALLAMLCVRARGLGPLRELLLQPGYVALLAILLFVFWFTQGRVFANSDDLTFWGLAVKETLRLDGMYNLPGSVLTHHLEYPPAIILFEALWCKLAGGFSEVSVYRGLEVFTLALMLPVFHGARWRNWGKNLALLGLLMLIPGGYGSMFYHSAYIDAAVAVLLGYTAAMALWAAGNGAFGYVTLGLGVFAACQAKTMGYFVLVLVVLLVAFKAVAGRPGKGEVLPAAKKGWWVSLRGPALVLGVSLGAALMARFSWSLFRAVYGIGGTAFKTGGVSLGEVARVLAGGGTEEQNQVLGSFGRALLSGTVTKYAVMEMTFLGLVVLFTMLAVLAARRPRRTGSASELRAVAAAIPAAGAVYALSMLLLYLFSFNRYDSLTLSSYNRYMFTYVIAAEVLLLLACILAEQPEMPEATKRGERIYWPAVAALYLVLAVGPDSWNLWFPSEGVGHNPLYGPYTSGAQALVAQVDPGQDKVYIICENPDNGTGAAFTYYASPLAVNNTGYDLTAEAANPGSTVLPMTPAEWTELLRREGYDYVFLHTINQAFIDEFGQLFNETPVDGGLYRVQSAQNGQPLVLETVLSYEGR